MHTATSNPTGDQEIQGWTFQHLETVSLKTTAKGLCVYVCECVCVCSPVGKKEAAVCSTRI